jgi:hypothetical protein
MSRTDRGRLALRNIKFDLQHDRIDPAHVRRFLIEVARQWNGKTNLVGSRNAKNPALEVFKSAIEASEAWCKGKPRVQSHSWCATVTSATRFFEQIDLDAAGFPEDADVSDQYLEDLESRPSLAHLIKSDASAPFSTRARVGWVTAVDGLDDLRNRNLKEGELAARVRAALGLHHDAGGMVDEIFYVEIRFPAGAFCATSATERMADLTPPTFADGGASRVFRSANPGDGWGRTFDLDRKADGMPEAVHPRIPLRGDFTMKRIGAPIEEPSFKYSDVLTGVDAWEPADCAKLVELCLTT